MSVYISLTTEWLSVGLALFVHVDFFKRHFIHCRLDAGVGKVHTYGYQEGH